MDFKDWFVVFLIVAIEAVATVFLFLVRSPAVFVTWAGVTTTTTGLYHFLVIRDSKQADACSHS